MHVPPHEDTPRESHQANRGCDRNARQIGGSHIAVLSILSNPDQDPHLFETTSGVVRQSRRCPNRDGAKIDALIAKIDAVMAKQ